MSYVQVAVTIYITFSVAVTWMIWADHGDRPEANWRTYLTVFLLGPALGLACLLDTTVERLNAYLRARKKRREEEKNSSDSDGIGF